MNIVYQLLGYFNVPSINNIKNNSNIEDEENISKKINLLEKRKKVIGSKCQIFYEDDPFVVSRASMQYLYDENGTKFIDCISNVQHVGHCHPYVVSEISDQLSTATCNVRFVNPKLTECAEELLKTLPEFDTVLFCNSGSEANDLALRLARDYTKKRDIIVLDHAYHGHVTTTMEMSPYKFNHGCTINQPSWVHVVPTPDIYRGEYRLPDDKLNDKEECKKVGKKYSQKVKDILDKENEYGVAAFIGEALQSCGGQIIPPEEYFKDVAKYIKDHGGLIIIDEVQTGFGRVGKKYWAHKLYDDGFIPDIVTMGKPMGNGFPVSAVVTTKKIADCLGGKVGYFNTYGGNPVACRAALAVMNTIKKENLLEHTEKMVIGDVRGIGQFWGLDIIESPKTREPNSKLALSLILKLRQEYQILLNADGPYTNILKFKPPLSFNENNLNEVIEAIHSALISLGY
ncbi:5-phosphohydroxy-L-lysine phospho-lyase [Strongyloides ratti]|uniref:5-phosphohydroxy-L-lysine phospho-lyase n=1 Tax=Strongyloides ratti TaxID=34506 RepID=A0A090KRX7_STRRB|nr:5-phosphohydroxy-L-lysine phospho-lyase [Strongyloides ratti]CEF60235.1 5-phosphohydroxy-L-lysine phospho-lyase [Strongyloides ratti]